MGIVNSAAVSARTRIASSAANAGAARRTLQRPSEPAVTLYRGIKENFGFFDEKAAKRFRVLDRKFVRHFEPSYFDRFLIALTGKPIMSKAKIDEFLNLRHRACAQSFSDDPQVAWKWAGNFGYMISLQLPFTEAMKYMTGRDLAIGDKLLPCATVFFVPSQLITLNVAKGLWTIAIDKLDF